MGIKLCYGNVVHDIFVVNASQPARLGQLVSVHT